MGADTTMSKAGRASAGKLAMRWTVRVIKLLALVFVLAHAYALAMKWAPVPGSILMMQRTLAGEDFRRAIVPLEDISPKLVTALIAWCVRAYAWVNI